MGGSGEAPRTGGRVIHRAGQYDLLIKLLTLGKEKAIRGMTLELARVSPGEKVLDVGCGTGTLTIMAKGAVGRRGEVCGIDPAPEMIDVARRKAARARMEVDFRVGLVESIPFADGSFDAVLSSFMVHHLPEEVKVKGFREVRRVLRPGGRLLVMDIEPSGSTATGRLLAHLIGHGRMKGNIGMLPAALREAGFEPIETGATRYGPLSYALATRGDS